MIYSKNCGYAIPVTNWPGGGRPDKEKEKEEEKKEEFIEEKEFKV
jgi:hypothetical protein